MKNTYMSKGFRNANNRVKERLNKGRWFGAAGFILFWPLVFLMSWAVEKATDPSSPMRKR